MDLIDLIPVPIVVRELFVPIEELIDLLSLDQGEIEELRETFDLH